jgi:hypothetical protein
MRPTWEYSDGETRQTAASGSIQYTGTRRVHLQNFFMKCIKVLTPFLALEQGCLTKPFIVRIIGVSRAMFARLAALVCLLLVCASLTLSETVGPLTGEVNVYLRPPANLSPAVAQWMREESSLLMRSAGYQVRWLNPQERPDVPGTSLIVVELSGTCAPPDRPARPVDAGRLASTVVTDGRILPFISVDCAALQKALGPALDREPRGRRDFLYGRAVGRVLAHEMYHVESQTREHSRQGVAESAVSAGELVSERFEFAHDAVARLRASVPQADDDSYTEDTAGR